MTSALLELAGVRAGYDSIQVLDDVDLTVEGGSVFALLGPNGAGKSTTVRVCAGLLQPTAGEVRIAGRVVNGARADELARRGVCTIPENAGVFPNLTVAENLLMATRAGPSLAAVEAVAAERFPQLLERRSQLAGTLSGGEQRMLALVRALANAPGLLLLDELSAGLAPRLVAELYETVGHLATEGVTVLVVEQFARAVLGVADAAAIMLGGRIAEVGAPAALEERLEATYLGAGT